MQKDIDRLAKIIWDYHLMHHTPTKSDAIFVLCSNDTRVAERGAQLFLEGWAPYLIFSGGVGVLTKDLFQTSEAETFAEIARALGVPNEHILIEPHSTNTGENITFTRAMLEEKRLDLQSFILVQKPYMERRTYATFMKQWPGKEFMVTSPQILFEDYPNERLSKDLVINVMLGDLQRIKEYPAKGFQIEQDIPDEVWETWKELVALGYDKHLIKSS